MADKRPLRRCIVCAIRDDPIEPERPVHLRPGRPENGYLQHRFDPGERRIEDRGRAMRRNGGY